MSDDRRMGYPPAADWRRVWPEVADDWPLGVPKRVADEWEAKRAAKHAAIDRLLVRKPKICTQCMTLGDAAGLGITLAPGEVTMRSVRRG